MALSSSKIPPQAYTRDTLVKAIEWLSSQPPAVRERANSADLIVSHYLQARRSFAAAQMEAPISQENFKADLKHLAEDLKRFEEPSPPPPQPQPTRSPTYVQLRPEPAVVPMPPPPSPAPAQAIHSPSLRSRESEFNSPQGPVWAVDARSLVVVRELQDRLNLSSEGEAIRMLIAFGVERARSLLD